ncbi:MAG: amidohydrolase, partial [Firmicutes bacterium]|nr:amidohydrolase [Bacillota bacterium]
MRGILEAAKKIEAQIIEDRRTIHQYPEMGFELPRTAAYVQKRLAEMGIESQICGGPLPLEAQEGFAAAGFPVMKELTGVVATIGHGEPCILLRADMDALPMMEAPDKVE